MEETTVSTQNEDNTPLPGSESSELEKLQKEYEAVDHKYKLALADYQNLLKQGVKDRRDAILYANEALILELLPVYDNLKLSFKHSGEDNQAWLTGLQHVIQQFKKVLEEAGVVEIKTENQFFDPTSMEAVETRTTNDKKLDGLVAEELKGGYSLNEKVIIPARVAVYALAT